MHGNLFDRLPPAAAARWSALLRLRDARQRELSFARDARRTLADDLGRLERQLTELRRTEPRYEWQGGRNPVEVPPPKPDPVREQQLASRIEHGVAELARRETLVAEADRAYQPVVALVDRIVTTLADIPSGAILDVDEPEPHLEGNETFEQAVGRLRARLADIVRQRQTIVAAPVDRETAKERARQAVAALAVRPPVEALFATDGTGFTWPQARLPHLPVTIRMVGPHGPYEMHGSAPPPDLPNVLGLLAWAKPSILDAVLAEIEATAPTNGLSADERAARLAALDTERLDLERAEEALIELAETDGVVIERRPDADPRAVLCIELIEPEPVEVMEAA